MDFYNKLKQEEEAKKQEKERKRISLEKQLKIWKARQEELRKAALSSLDESFVKRNLDKCSKEVKRISDLISTL